MKCVQWLQQLTHDLILNFVWLTLSWERDAVLLFSAFFVHPSFKKKCEKCTPRHGWTLISKSSRGKVADMVRYAPRAIADELSAAAIIQHEWHMRVSYIIQIEILQRKYIKFRNWVSDIQLLLNFLVLEREWMALLACRSWLIACSDLCQYN